MGAKVTMPGLLRQAESILKHHKPVTRELIVYSKLLSAPYHFQFPLVMDCIPHLQLQCFAMNLHFWWALLVKWYLIIFLQNKCKSPHRKDVQLNLFQSSLEWVSADLQGSNYHKQCFSTLFFHMQQHGHGGEQPLSLPASINPFNPLKNLNCSKRQMDYKCSKHVVVLLRGNKRTIVWLQ